MTNTRITDPESLERRYPVIVRQFSLRPGSGGRGQFQGGNGIIRDVEFRTPMVASTLSERRSFQPYGLSGGEGGQRGRNLWLRSDGREINIGGKRSVRVGAGDRFRIETPGGGGFGSVESGTLPESEVGEVSGAVLVAGGSIGMRKAMADQV